MWYKKYEGRKVLNDFKLNLFCGEIVNLVGIRDYENDCLMDLFSGKDSAYGGKFLLEEKTIDLMKKNHSGCDESNMYSEKIIH